ncbi:MULTISPECIES: HAMP domain-containing sensor histidine kinase [Halorussus]|uniref:sensor histidine kinase n=1 Tax=Halorussus TaxID=1070314 RepID=UPI000E2103DF|nr:MULTISPECIES: HAMP domain-containing sensor histidine kinase [Halorussus]NHN57620.1 HAMP domain-containing histidine kinase [Halorussus sp. JP-T4]
MSVPSASFPRSVTLGGLTVAGIGFFLTRFTVTLAAYEEPTAFYLAGLLPLVLGLLLAAFGVALVVGPFDPAFVRRTAVWCLAGTGAMAALVGLTLLGSNPRGVGGVGATLSEAYLSNFLIGGGVGGTLTGVYAARSERQRGELRWQANRLVTLNRILRHEVLNSVTAISGYADVVADRDGGAGGDDPRGDRAVEVIRRRSGHIVDTIEDVQYLTESARSAETDLVAVDLVECLDRSIEAVRERHPDAEYVLGQGFDGPVPVWANSQLDRLFEHLLDNAVEHNDAEAPRVEVSVDVAGQRATVRVADDGPGLPDRQRSILETGAVAEHDDPASGFGLNVVRLLVERFRGGVSTDVSDAGTTVAVSLVRATGSAFPGTGPSADRAYGVATPRLAVAVGAALVAGVAMGAFSQAVASVIPVIGALYGVAHPVVGWVTHEFHSVVFGMVFTGLLTAGPGRRVDGPGGHVLAGAAWGVLLWAVAAGVVMPVWLRLVGIPAPVPNLGPTALGSHLVWGVSLGGLYYLGTEWLDARAVD